MKKIIIIITISFTTLVAAACNQKQSASAVVTTDTITKKKISCPACGSICKMPSRSIALLAVPKDIITRQDGSSADEMVVIPGGTFQMGSNDFEDSKPVHNVTVKPFLMDEHEVTNAQFENL